MYSGSVAVAELLCMLGIILYDLYPVPVPAVCCHGRQIYGIMAVRGTSKYHIPTYDIEGPY